MADHLGGLHGANFDKPEVLARAIVNAAEARFSKYQAEQVPHNPVGVMKAAASHLSKREQRETGIVHKESPAAKALSEFHRSQIGKGGDVEREVGRLMQERGLVHKGEE
ncbi:hypothetical protein Ndes2526B_g04162 [Nannochloris sp. 'desiccata']|nr:hypothetical protein KSW81_001063 [Chlorella desiccata (nom. nud.)]KAH7620248.1 hypothetical protein NADE_002875 [Chlorella desiccata (nom. nud.)]